MAKINNKGIYPEDEKVRPDDYLIGTDHFDFKKTKNYPIRNVAKTIAKLIDSDNLGLSNTSDLVNDGEHGNSRFVEENEIQTVLENVEEIANKQNSLNRDGSGEKYPTVDAVNEVISEVRQEISNTTSDKNFVYEQIFPAEIWDFEHPLDKKPTPVFVDSANTVMIGKVTINNGRRMKIEFNAPVNGFAILN